MLVQVEKWVSEVFIVGVEMLCNVKLVFVFFEEIGEIYVVFVFWQIQWLQVEKNVEVKILRYSFWYVDFSEIIYKIIYGEYGFGNFGMVIIYIFVGNWVYCWLMYKLGQWFQVYMDLGVVEKMQDFVSDIIYVK